ncbi:MAG: NAD(P)H-binding protein [Holophagaceae bacterium]|nr:NAD(P)H-binding protein [Holophagaceae bacterium]
MPDKTIQAVTGAYGYSGKYIASRLLAQGQQVITLTDSGQRPNPFGGQVRAVPFNFEDPAALARSLEKVEVLYNTYWVRFNHKLFRHQEAVRNTLALFKAAQQAGVRRIVHVSITNPSESSPLEYFRGKAMLERALTESGISYAILRPAVIFGKEDILINNIAWAVRRLPVFGVFGDGRYRLQPIYVEDLADLAVRCGAGREDEVIDAIGPETYTYRELVRTIARLLDVRCPVFSVPPRLGLLAGQALGWLARDVTITQEEIEGLMADLLYTPSPPAGKTRLSEWIQANADMLGRSYASELARRVDRGAAY